MSPTLCGTGIAAFLAVMLMAFGWTGFLVAALFMAIGALVGRAMSGKLDWRGVADALGGRRSSS